MQLKVTHIHTVYQLQTGTEIDQAAAGGYSQRGEF